MAAIPICLILWMFFVRVGRWSVFVKEKSLIFNLLPIGNGCRILSENTKLFVFSATIAFGQKD